jgi:cation diffusion facilitator CzcD-associated flavoprotein CzcO
MSRAAETTDVLIVGAGLSGVGAACQLRQECPDKSVIVLEARNAIGGTWDLFRYQLVIISCSFLYVCTGYYRYDEGFSPKFPGVDHFRGPVIHPQHSGRRTSTTAASGWS